MNVKENLEDEMKRSYMKRLLLYIASMLVAGAVAGCSNYKIIPDDQLADIFHDAYLTNAYIQQQGLRLDSMNIYEPIFARYGYTTADVQYTIGNFSKRKSARLSEVVEQAIEQLEAESKYYEHEVAILDTIDHIAQRTLRRTLLSDSVIRLSRLRDTSRLRFVVDSIRPGSYTVTFDYHIDSLDRNTQQRTSVWLERADGRRVSVSPTYMARRRIAQYRRELTADSNARRLVLNIYEVRDRDPKQPHAMIRNLRVDYTPYAEEAVDSLFLRQLNLKLFADDFCNPVTAADSVALSADSLGTAAAAAGEPR